MKSMVYAACGVLGLLLLGHPEGVPSASAEEEAGSAGATTNELIFKKRTRRQYNSAVTINRPEGVVSAPVEEEEDHRPMGTEPRREGLSVGRNSAPSMMHGTPRKPQRSGRDKKKDDEDWLLTPQQRIQKEIDLLSGKEEEEEEESAYGWLADEVASIRDEKIKEQERRRKEEEEEAEAEEIAAIMGRDLFGTAVEKRTTGLLRDDRGRLQMPSTSEQRPGFGSDATNSVSAPALQIRDRDGADAEIARRSADGGLRTEAPRDREETRKTPSSPGGGTFPGVAADTKTGGQAARTVDGKRPSAEEGMHASATQPVSTGVPSLFSWNSGSGGGYAGLPSSIAPSITPAQGSGPASGAWIFNSGAPSGAQGGQANLSRWTETRYSYDSQSARPLQGTRLQPGGAAGGASVIHTPFMNSMTPGLQGGSGYGTFPARRP